MDVKTFQNLQTLGFTPSPAKPEMERKLEEEAPALKMTLAKSVRVTRNGSGTPHRKKIGEDKNQPVMGATGR